jgi:tripartite-type tricarboxylate transporter receptor subunit TctC
MGKLRLVLAALALSALALSACSSSGGPASGASQPGSSAPVGTGGQSSSSGSEGVPFKQLNLDVSTKAGGSLDTLARMLVPGLKDALGVTVTVVDNDAGAGAISDGETVQKGNDCSYLSFNQAPAILHQAALKGVPFKISDFTAVAAVARDYGSIAVLKSSKWKTFADFLADAKAHPKKISVAVGPPTSNYAGLLELEKIAGVKFNVVTFAEGGGSVTRNAVLGGHVDAVATNIYSAQGDASKFRFLAVQAPANNWKDITNNAPTMTSVVGKTVPDAYSVFGVFASTTCATKHADTFKTIANAVASAAKSTSFVSSMKKLNRGGNIAYLDTAQFKDAVDVLAKQAGLSSTN